MERLCGALIGVMLAMLYWPAGADADEAGKSDLPTMSLWTGASASVDSVYLYVGAAYALSGDIDEDGFIVRVGLGGGEYRTSGSNSHDVDHYGIDLMLGYRTSWDRSIITLYAGADVDQHNNRDPDSDMRGTELGLKLQAEFYAPLSDAAYFSAFANYSTAFQTFNATAKVLYRPTDVLAIGPEIAVLGSQGFDQARTGLAAAYMVVEDTELSISTGYAWAMDEDSEGGIYGGINLYTKF